MLLLDKSNSLPTISHKKLSVITPYYDRPNVLTTFAKAITRVSKKNINFYLITPEKNKTIENICIKAGIHYHSPAGIAKNRVALRNEGVSICNSKFIFKQDIDTIPYIGFYDTLIAYMDRLTVPYDFISIPCYYLDKEKSKRIDPPITKDIFNELKQHNIHHQPIGFLYAMQRSTYLEIGGESEEFKSWGFEDYYIIHKLHMLKTNKYWKTSSIVAVTRATNEFIDYIMSINLEMAEKYNLALLHKYHPQEKDHNNVNKELYKRLILNYIRNHQNR